MCGDRKFVVRGWGGWSDVAWGQVCNVDTDPELRVWIDSLFVVRSGMGGWGAWGQACNVHTDLNLTACLDK